MSFTGFSADPILSQPLNIALSRLIWPGELQVLTFPRVGLIDCPCTEGSEYTLNLSEAMGGLKCPGTEDSIISAHHLGSADAQKSGYSHHGEVLPVVFPFPPVSRGDASELKIY